MTTNVVKTEVCGDPKHCPNCERNAKVALFERIARATGENVGQELIGLWQLSYETFEALARYFERSAGRSKGIELDTTSNTWLPPKPTDDDEPITKRCGSGSTVPPRSGVR